MQSSRRVAQVAEVAEVVEVARVTKSCTKSICGQNDMAVTVATIVARQTPIKGALPLTFKMWRRRSKQIKSVMTVLKNPLSTGEN